MKNRLIALFSLMLIASGSFASEEVWVSTKGKSSGNGSKSSPVQTLQQAVDLLAKSYKKEAFTEATILLKAGTYNQTQLVKLDRSLFDNNNVKITIKSADKEKAQISGGYAIPTKGLKKVTDKTTIARLNDDAASKILVVDLKGSGIETAFSQNGENTWNYRYNNYSYVSWDSDLLQVAQWPNRGYGHIAEVQELGPTTRWLKPGEKPATYSYEDPNGAIFTLREKTDLTKWATEINKSQDVLLQGYVHNDWFFQQEKVARFDNNAVELLRYTRYGVVINKNMLPRRVRFVNLLCELDEPGEWYFDNQTKEFFIYPIKPITSKTAITVLGGEKMLEVTNLDNFKLENVIFENGGAMAIELNNSSESLVAGCTFRNFNGRAFNINGGKNSGIQSCDLYGLQTVGSISGDYNGDKAAGTGLHIDAEGQSRQTLKPCGNFMINNHIYNCRLRGYGLIGLNGVGLHFAHNVIHDTNGGMTFSGNDIIMEYNEFYNMGWEMGDWNVAYIGADWASFGNEMRYNFVHHLMEMPGAYPVEGFRNDDGGMGVQFHGNIFYKSGRGCVAFSGAGNGCYNNIALQTSTVYQAHLAELSADDIKNRWNKMKEYDDGKLVRGDKDDLLWRAERFYGKMGWNFEPYRSKYPTLKKIMDDGNPFAPAYAVIQNNYIDKDDLNKGFYIHRGSVDMFPESTTWELPEHITMDSFENPDVLNFALKSSFKPMNGFEVTDFTKIGMYADEYRPTPPNKEEYRKEVKDRYKDMRSNGGRYNMDKAYERYPIPEYLKNIK